MSLPETQPEFSGNQRADRLDVLAASFCRGQLEQLFEKGRSIGRLALLHGSDREVDVKISPNPGMVHNDFRTPVLVTETANFYAAQDDGVMTYRIRHLTDVKVIGGARRQLRREFWMFYDKLDDSTYELNPSFSRHEATIEMCSGQAEEEVATVWNEGRRLNEMQQAILDTHHEDMGLIKGYQVQEVKRLTERALEGLRTG